MRSPAKLHRVTVELLGLTSDLDHPDSIPVFFAEKLHHLRPILDLIVIHLKPMNSLILQNPLIDQPLNVSDLFGSQRLGVEIEGQFLRPHVGSLLTRVPAHYFMKGPVKKMGHGMVPLNRIPSTPIHHGRHRLPRGQPLRIPLQEVYKRRPHLDRLPHLPARPPGFQHPLVPHLTSHFCIEGCRLEKHAGFLLQFDDLHDFGVKLAGIKSVELGGGSVRKRRDFDRLLLLRGLGPLTLECH